MAKGGKRPGAGRPVGSKGGNTIEAEKAKEYIAQRVAEELEPIISKAIEQAKTGDKDARRELFDRAFGRPKESLDLNADGHITLDEGIYTTLDKIYGAPNGKGEGSGSSEESDS